MTGMLKCKDDREFGKLGVGNGVEIESPMSKKILAFSPKEGSATRVLKFRGDGDFEMGNGAGLDTPICCVVSNEVEIEERVQKEGNNGFGNEGEIESLNHTPNFVFDDVSNYNFSVEDMKRLKMVKRKETNREFVKSVAGNGVEIGSPEYIVSASEEILTPKFDIIDDVIINNSDKEDKATGELKKVLMNGSKRAREQECCEDLVKAEIGNEAKIGSPDVSLFNAFETQNSDIANSSAGGIIDVKSSKAIEFSSLSSDICKNCASNLSVNENHGSHVMHTMEIEKGNPFHDASGNVSDDGNTIAIKEQKTLSDVRAKEVMESLKRMDKEEPRRDLGKMEVDNEFRTPISKLDSGSGTLVQTERLRPHHGASYTVEIENVKTNADKEEKEVSSVRKKVAKKGQEKVKKKELVKELGKVEADEKTTTEISYLSKLGVVELRKSKSDIDEPNSSDMLVIQNPGSNVVPSVDFEKPNSETDGSVDMNASKEDNNAGIVSLVGAAVEACNARIADAMVLTGEVEVPKRRKRRKTPRRRKGNFFKIFIGALDIGEPNSSDMLVIQNPGSYVVPLVDFEKPNSETDGSVDMNASKEDNSAGIVSLVGAEVEACNARIADPMVLTGEVEVPKRKRRRKTQKRRKGQKTKIFVGGLNIDEPNSSDMLVIKNPGSYVVPLVESEKPNAETDGSFDMNASKEDNDSGIVSLVGAEVEACNTRIADAMVLTGKVEVPKRRKRRKTPRRRKGKKSKIFIGALDIVEPNSSDMLVIQNSGSYVVPLVESEKPNAETDGSVDMNASKEDNDPGIVSLVGAEVKACNARIADAMVLTGEVEVPKRRKIRKTSKRRKIKKTKIFVGGLDKGADEKDVRNSLLGERDIAEVTAKMHEKAGEDNVLSSPVDAKKVKKKLGKVEAKRLKHAPSGWRQPQRSLGVGSPDLDYFHSLVARKRRFSHLLLPYHSDPRRYPRSWDENAYPAVNPSNHQSIQHPPVSIPGSVPGYSRLFTSLGMQSLPSYHLQGSGYPSGLTYEAYRYFNRSQVNGSPSIGATGVYPRSISKGRFDVVMLTITAVAAANLILEEITGHTDFGNSKNYYITAFPKDFRRYLKQERKLVLWSLRLHEEVENYG